ncbi:MAG: poly-gamma-glutamate system protein [Candidatus Latescibacteria bacterium]|nr:poly-gamma-glutamate system protein [Candidatus Latescibacterota bacterium]
MKKREGKVGRHVLIIFAVLSVLLLIIVFRSKHNVRTRNFETKVKASQICQEAMYKVKQERVRLGIPIDNINDPNQTGLVGAQYTPITMDRTDLSSALTSTNPNFAAIFVDLLTKSRIQAGDVIAVGIDGSYPALNLALYSALRIMNVKPVIVTTLSSVMWGANYPDLTWLDMERVCFEQRIFTFKSSAATLGGEDDNGRGFSPEAWEQMLAKINQSEVIFINNDDLESNIAKRIALYETAGKIKAFVNIGRSVANLGEHRLQLNSGLIKSKPKKLDGNFVVLQMLDNKIPVINITEVNRLARKYGLPIAPVPMQPVGKGRLFIEEKFSIALAIIFSLLIILLLYFVIRYDLEYYLSKKSNNNNQ